MTRALLVAVAATVVAAGCGSAGGGGPTATSTGVRAPKTQPPTTGAVGPPEAWVETKRGSRWLGFGTYCWTEQGSGLCADMIEPSCEGPAPAPRIVVDGGEAIRFHLAFDPQEVAMTLPGQQKLETSRTPTWTVRGAGAFSVFARPRQGGDASYTGCLVIAAP